MNRKFCGSMGIALLAIAGSSWASSAIQRMTSTKESRLKSPLHPDGERMAFTPNDCPELNLDEGVSITDDSFVMKDLREARNDFALAIFTVNNCLACKSQKKTLMQFKEQYGWKIKEFNVLKHEKLVNAFNISSVPTILLIRRSPAQWFQLSKRRLTLPDTEKTVANGLQLMRSWDKN